MNASTDKHRRTFILATARTYVPGSLPKEVRTAAGPQSSGGGCCGSVPTPTPRQSSGCGTSGCDAGSNARQTTSCC